MRKILRDFFTGLDGTTYDLGRALWALASLPLLLVGTAQAAAAFLSLDRSAPALAAWSAQDWTIWAGGVGGLLAAGAGALYMKRGTEPSTTTATTTVASDTPQGPQGTVAQVSLSNV